jgi:hypothetical protein
MNFTSYLIGAGINQNLLFLILALPFITLVVSFFRYFIGIKTFGIYEPIVLAYALFTISQNFLVGLYVGLPLLLLAWIITEASNKILDRIRLHYISKVSLRISLASIFLLGILFASVYFHQAKLFAIDPLVLIIFLTLVETITLFQYKKGSAYTNLVSLETLGVTLISYLILTASLFQKFLLVNPYFVIVPLIFNLFVGRWNGLRLTEYLRFRNIFKND